MFFRNVEREITNKAADGLEPKEKERFLHDYSVMKKSEWMTFWLCLLLGRFGVHQFYLNNHEKGWIYLGLNFVPAIITFVGFNPVGFVLLAIGQIILYGFILVDLFTFIRITNDANRKVVDAILWRIGYKN